MAVPPAHALEKRGQINIFLQRPITAMRILITHANSSLLHQKNTEKVLKSG
jgi:hypothetical protein